MEDYREVFGWILRIRKAHRKLLDFCDGGPHHCVGSWQVQAAMVLTQGHPGDRCVTDQYLDHC